MFDWLLGLVAPHDCLVCGEEGALLCAYCAPDATAPLPARCYRCKAASGDSAVCVKCRPKTPLRYVWVRAQYTGIAKQLIYRLKFGRTKAAAKTIAELLHDTLPALDNDTTVTHVPTATSRIRLRGYDQSQLIAREFAKLRRLEHRSLLSRQGQSRQVGSDRKHRQQQAMQNYLPLRAHNAKGLKLLLIDDIVTTGASLEAAAKVLRKNGAKGVNAAVFAQK